MQAYPSRCEQGCVYFFLLTVRTHYKGASIKYVRAEGEGGVNEMPNFAYG